jgi:hypothetical protein
MDDDYGSALLEQHAAYLRERGVSPDVASQRGYRSADTRTQLKSIGFGESQRRPPGLIIPTYDVVGTDGECAGYQYRPDHPRAVDGRVSKFEVPRGARLSLDVHPRVRPHLGNPTTPLWVPEGAVKADAAISRGLAAVALFGVYAWKVRNDFGATTVMPQLEYLALKDRLIYLAFDNDLLLKIQVYDALSRLRDVLAHRGADVAVVMLPAGEHGEKTGLDDYFVRGGTVDELLTHHVSAELPKPPTVGREKDKGPEPIVDDTATLAGLLEETVADIRRYVVFDTEHQPRAVALWVAHCYCIDAFDVSPRLLVTAPTIRAAKSRLLDVVQRTTPRAKRCGSTTGASVFRLIEQLKSPTLLIDEADRVFRNAGIDPAADLLAQVIDQGHERGNPALRTERDEDGSWVVQEFETFTPTAIAGVDRGSNWPDSVLDRAMVIRMRRRRKSEHVERLPKRGASATAGKELARRWAGYVQSHPELIASLSGAFPDLPSELNDRACDSWEPLLAIADAAGGAWPAWGRDAARHLTDSDEPADNLGVQLLADLKKVWPVADVVTGTELVELLKDDDDDQQWRNYGKQGKGLTPKSMANILRPFSINPDQHWVDGRKIRGYARADFVKAWAAYVPDDDDAGGGGGGGGPDTPVSGGPSGSTGRTLTDTGESPPPEPVGDDSALPLRNDPDPLQGNGPTGTTTSDARKGGYSTSPPSCSRCGTTDATHFVPAHWDPALELCSACCLALDEVGEIPKMDPDPVPAPDDAEAVEQLLAMGTVVGEKDPSPVCGRCGVPEYDHSGRACAHPFKPVPPLDGGRWLTTPTWSRPAPTSAPEQAVRLAADAREHYRAGGKIKSKALRHVWMVCDTCGEGVMRKKSAGPKKCVITPGCEGSHRP